MKLNLKTTAAVLAIGMVAYAAYAENVTVSTYYPSPYGSYQTLETTAAASFATASGNVGIGLAAPAAAGPNVKLSVQGGQIRATDAAAGTATAIIWGAVNSAYFGAADTRPTYIGNSDRNDTLVVDNYSLTVNGNGAGVLGSIAADNQTLNSLSLKTNAGAGSNTGTLQVICDTGNKCYAVAAYL